MQFQYVLKSVFFRAHELIIFFFLSFLEANNIRSRLYANLKKDIKNLK